MQQSEFVPSKEQASQNTSPRWHNAMGAKNYSNSEDFTHQESSPPDPILQQLRAGSEAAFNKIYWENSPHLLQFAISVVESREVAEDLCADIFCMFWEMRDKFTLVRNVKAFLFVSMRNAALNYLKSKAIRDSRREDYICSLEDPHWDPTECPNDVRSEYKKRILGAIHTLPDQCKRVFILFFFEELRIDEVAARIGISRHTVKSHKYRALCLLRGAVIAKHVINATILIYLLVSSY